jgi:hypothetical protein
MTANFYALPNGNLDGAELQNGLFEVLQGNPSKLTLPVKAVQDKYELLPAFLKASLLCSPLQLCTVPRCAEARGPRHHEMSD